MTKSLLLFTVLLTSCSTSSRPPTALPVTAAAAAPAPVVATAKPLPAGFSFDKYFASNLVKLDGDALRPVTTLPHPSKYYLFYYSASWCGPCHQFTPTLVKYYNDMKAQYPHEFELVLITRDTEEADMTAYAKEMNMPWPQLKLSKAEQFREEVTIGGKGIPGVVLTDLHGKVLESTYHNGEYVGPEIALLKMKELLK